MRGCGVGAGVDASRGGGSQSASRSWGQVRVGDQQRCTLTHEHCAFRRHPAVQRNRGGRCKLGAARAAGTGTNLLLGLFLFFIIVLVSAVVVRHSAMRRLDLGGFRVSVPAWCAPLPLATSAPTHLCAHRAKRGIYGGGAGDA